MQGISHLIPYTFDQSGILLMLKLFHMTRLPPYMGVGAEGIIELLMRLKLLSAALCWRLSSDVARGVLINITSGTDLGLFEVNEAADIVAGAADPLLTLFSEQ